MARAFTLVTRANFIVSVAEGTNFDFLLIRKSVQYCLALLFNLGNLIDACIIIRNRKRQEKRAALRSEFEEIDGNEVEPNGTNIIMSAIGKVQYAGKDVKAIMSESFVQDQQIEENGLTEFSKSWKVTKYHSF